MYRKERIAEQLKSFLSVELSRLHDPRLEFVILNEVRVSNDLRAAKIFWGLISAPVSDSDFKESSAAFPSSDKQDEVTQALKGAMPLLKRRIAADLSLRHVPDLLFVYDKSAETGSRIDELLDKAGL